MAHLQVNERTESARRANNFLFNIHVYFLGLLLSQKCYFSFYALQNSFHVATVKSNVVKQSGKFSRHVGL